MASYTTLVNVDAEAALKLAQFVSQLLPTGESQQFLADCQKSIDSVKTPELINKLLEQTNLILSIEEENVVIGCFQSLFTVIYTLGDDTNELPIVKSVVAALISDNSQARLRLQALVTLFNLAFSGESKYEVMNAIFTFANASQQTQLISHFYSKYDEWQATWGISAEQQRTLLKSIAQALEKDGQHSVALRALTRYFKTFAGVAAYPADVESLIVNAVLHAIQTPLAAFGDRTAIYESFNSHQFSQPLGSLVTLLKIICDGSLEEFAAFQASNASVFATYKLDASAIEHNIKLLTLCSLAAQTTDKVLSYAAIQSALQIDESEVELWTIEAVSENLLEASIDQLSNTVTINRYAHRSFGVAHWKAVQQKLRNLRKNMANVVDSVNRNRAPVPVSN